ncbi:MAG: acyl--CoA ligase [Deltaproteobacteria bacterium]|nr:acyl--CoA ligase [Deltaproteobacteria bacterium]
MNVVDHIRERAVEAPARPALVSGGSDGHAATLSYAELLERVDTRAASFRSDGLRTGDRCGLLAPQGATFIELALGVLAAGGCLVPVSEDHKGSAFDAFARRARLHSVVVAAAGGVEFRNLPDPGALDGAGDAEFRALAPAYLRFTSGTTHHRKGVILGHAAILARLAAANRALAIGPDDRVMWLLPMVHHFVVSILLYLRYGATILLPQGSLARDILEFSRRERATVFYASPYHYRVLGKDESGLGLDSLRLAVSTAEGLRRDIADRFIERFGLPVAQALGIIEVGLPVVNLSAPAQKPDSLGRPLPDYEVWLRGEDGRPVTGPTSAERTGEICIRGPGMLDAYLDPWLPAAVVLEPDGFRTGDQGWFDVDGDLYLAGRRSSRISMAGMKFFGEEVEAVVDAHPAVRECRVFPQEHPHLGEIPVAEVVPEDPQAPPAAKELIAHCRASLPGYKVPRKFLIVDALVRTTTGKLQRHTKPGTLRDGASDSPARER